MKGFLLYLIVYSDIVILSGMLFDVWPSVAEQLVVGVAASLGAHIQMFAQNT